MRKDILFVREAPTFLVNAMTKTLKDAGYNIVASQPDIVEIDLIKNLPDIYIIYLEGDIDSFNGTIKYLKKKMIEEDKDHFLFLIGNPLEINTALEVIPKTLVTETFIRPVNMQEVLTKLAFLVNEGEATGGRKRILVVDDDSVILRTMNNWFSSKYEVFMANSGMNAISLLAQHHVDLILLDYEMPVVSGLQVFNMLRSEPATANIPVIFLTAKDDKETVMKVVAAKPDKYLLKTMPPEELVKAVSDFFRGK
ncbi:MAG: response regulator [Treponema sp.]|nr:response regulator [Treponema sp.]